MTSGIRLNVTLDEEYSAKFARLAERTHIHQGTLARSLLSQAIDWADADPGSVVEILDGIDGAFERALVGLEQTQGSRTSALEDL